MKMSPPKRRRPRLIGSLIVVLALGAAAGIVWWQSPASPALSMNTTDPAFIATGQAVYAQHCASCHGVRLEGQADWRTRLPSGRMPAPPHDASGHTWHHPPGVLFDIVKEGVQKHAPPGYQSDMPAYAGVLSDEQIWAVLSYIRSTWPEDIRRRHDAIDRAARGA